MGSCRGGETAARARVSSNLRAERLGGTEPGACGDGWGFDLATSRPNTDFRRSSMD